MSRGPGPLLPPRPADGHKGTFGTVLVVGGSVGPRRMLGGPALCAAAAMRSGCGLCELAMPEPLLDAALAIVPTATGVPLPVDRNGEIAAEALAATIGPALERATVVAIGPGLGGSGGVDVLVETTISAARRLGRPIVADADALNAIARRPPAKAWPAMPPSIVTPHPGEFRRLATALGLADADPISPGGRPAAAAALARRLGAIVVLKGRGTIVSDGRASVVNATGNAGLATGGSGDVLTGMIAGLAASWFASRVPASRIAASEFAASGIAGDRSAADFPDSADSAASAASADREDAARAAVDAAVAGVWGHGRAAERAVERRAAGRPAGILATDLLDEIPSALAEASPPAGPSK